LKLLSTQANEVFLAQLGDEASAMLLRHDFSGLAKRFGYAVAFDRSVPVAIEADYLTAIASPNRGVVVASVEVDVKFFGPNDTGLFAAVECVVPVSGDASINLELIVTGKGTEKFITLEGISGVAF
jgi:hypothetical protein